MQIRCNCGATLNVRDELAGRKVRCPRCQSVLPIPAPEKTFEEISTNDQIDASVAEQPSDSTEKIKKGCGCCAVVFLVMALLGWIVGGPEVTVEGDTALVKVKMISEYSIEDAVLTLAEAVYDTAHKHDEVKRIRVLVYMSSMGLTDKYGKAITKDLLMGGFTIEDVAEVGKYRSFALYNQDLGVRVYYQSLLVGMKHSHLLRR